MEDRRWKMEEAGMQGNLFLRGDLTGRPCIFGGREFLNWVLGVGYWVLGIF
jgi:hypothetical protein